MNISIEIIDCSSNTHSSYSVNIYNNLVNTVVTHTSSIVDEYISDILHIHRHKLNRLVVGLDVEWHPNFQKKQVNPVALLQLCVGRRCLIFQILHASTVPHSLINFLNNPLFRFVGVGIKEDVAKLWKDYNLRVANAVDLRSLAVQQPEMNQLKNAGLKVFAKEVLHMEIQKPKGVTLSRWDANRLTYDQIQYACVDAFLSFEIGKALTSGDGKPVPEAPVNVGSGEDQKHTHSSYSVNIYNNLVNTVVTHTSSIVDEYISDILHFHRRKLNCLVVGLDVEWCPNFQKKQVNRVAVLQLCVGHRCLIFQILHASTVPHSLVNFLNNPIFKFVGVGIKEDIAKLWKDYNLQVANAVDLRSLAVQQPEMNQLKNASLKVFAKEVLHMEIQKPKRVTMSRWDANRLTYDQIQYACVDAFLSFEIGKVLTSGDGKPVPKAPVNVSSGEGQTHTALPPHAESLFLRI